MKWCPILLAWIKLLVCLCLIHLDLWMQEASLCDGCSLQLVWLPEDVFATASTDTTAAFWSMGTGGRCFLEPRVTMKHWTLQKCSILRLSNTTNPAQVSVYSSLKVSWYKLWLLDLAQSLHPHHLHSLEVEWLTQVRRSFGWSCCTKLVGSTMVDYENWKIWRSFIWGWVDRLSVLFPWIS